jgi:hypothetical protein
LYHARRPWPVSGTHVAGTGLSSLSCRFFDPAFRAGFWVALCYSAFWVCDHLVTSPRTVAPSPNISSLLPELPGAISVAPCCPCTVLARLWRHKALRGRVIHMICQACIRTYTQRANSSQPTSDVPACATRACSIHTSVFHSHERVPFTRACSIHALGLLLLDWSRCRAIPEWL